jgi:hypothetical protein
MRNPISDLMYDWITILQSKAEGINAYEKYLKDAQAESSQDCIDLLNTLRDQDIRMVEQISRHVAHMFGEQQQPPEHGKKHKQRGAEADSAHH